MRNESRGMGVKAWMLVTALALLVAAPALAAKGGGSLEGKNADKQTLELDELVIQVTEDTRIYDGDDKRMSFAQIPDPAKVPTTVEYEGKFSGKTLVADKLVVYMTPH